ncbi:MAG: hypothetical protein L6Q38_17970, partial [Nitrospira sp.]|nr:hypothetical protein [Nitrospira sp.]
MDKAVEGLAYTNGISFSVTGGTAPYTANVVSALAGVLPALAPNGLEFTITQDTPSSTVFTLTGTPAQGSSTEGYYFAATSYFFGVTVTDASATPQTSNTITFLMGVYPEFSLSPQTVTMMEGDEFNPQGSTNIDISGSYSETSPASGSYTLIEVTGLPPGVSITQGAAFAQKKIGVILQGMPEPGASLGSPYTAVVTVSDGLAPALVAELELEIIVMDGFDILTPDLPAATEAVAYNPFQIEIGAGVAPYTFSDVAGLPVGMTLSEDGILSGTP